MSLPDPKKFISPSQPPLVYDIKKPWEEIIKKPPVWKSGKFPPLSKEKKYRFLEMDFISPIAISAGPASGKIWTDFYFKMGYGLVIQKTRRIIPRESNKAPNIAIVHTEKPISRKTLGKTLKGSMDPNNFPSYLSMTNSFGNPSSNILTWANELKEQLKTPKDGQALACSVTATTGVTDTKTDLLVTGASAAVAGAKIIELNLACPNVTDNPQEGEMFQDPKLVKETLEEFKKIFPDIKIGFKFGIYNNKLQMKKVLKAAGGNLDYFSGINAIASPVTDEKDNDILPGRRVSGVAGKADREIALESIKWAKEIREELGLEYCILGGGGVTNAEDVDLYLKTGADMVQVAAIALADPLLAYKYHYSKST